jgi:hypothetical protein
MKPADIRQLCEVYGEHAMNDSMVKRWVRWAVLSGSLFTIFGSPPPPATWLHQWLTGIFSALFRSPWLVGISSWRHLPSPFPPSRLTACEGGLVDSFSSLVNRPSEQTSGWPLLVPKSCFGPCF